MIAEIRYRLRMTKPLSYMVLQKIKKGQGVAVSPNLGGVVLADDPNTIRVGIAKRDLDPGEIIEVILNGETKDVKNT